MELADFEPRCPHESKLPLASNFWMRSWLSESTTYIVAGAVDRQASRSARTDRACRRRSPTRFKDAGRAEALHDGKLSWIGDVDVALGPERHRPGEAQHALGTLPDDRDRGGQWLRA